MSEKDLTRKGQSWIQLGDKEQRWGQLDDVVVEHTAIPTRQNAPDVPLPSQITNAPLEKQRTDPLLIVCTRLGKGLYAICAGGVVGILTGSFIARLTAQNIVTGLAVAFLAGLLGLICEITVKGRGGWNE